MAGFAGLIAIGACARQTQPVEPIASSTQLELTYTYFEQGVAYHHRSDFAVIMTLQLSRDGAAVLRVVGSRYRIGTFVMDEGRESQESGGSIDERWIGRASRSGQTLRLSLSHDGEEAQIVCRDIARRIGGAKEPLLECKHARYEAEHPWNDQVREYFRVPVAFSRRGTISARVRGSAEDQPSVEFESLERSR